MQRLTLILFQLVLLASCIQPEHDYAKFQTLNGQRWSYGDTLHFGFKPTTPGKYRISLSVRYDKEYEFSNLWLKVSDNAGVSRVELPLFDAEGIPLGKCGSGLCTQMISWKDIDCNMSDSLHFAVVQNMRRDPLNHISDFGIIIDKVVNQ